MLDKDNWVGPRIALYQWIRTVLKMDPDPSPDTDSDQILGVKLLYDFFVYQSQTHSLKFFFAFYRLMHFQFVTYSVSPSQV